VKSGKKQAVILRKFKHVLDSDCLTITRVRGGPELGKTGWVLHHDNVACSRVAKSANSPDLAPLDLWLFPKSMEPMKGRRYEDLKDIQRAVTSVLKDLNNS